MGLMDFRSIIMAIEALIILLLASVTVYMYNGSVECKAANVIAKKNLKEYKVKLGYTTDNIDDIAAYYDQKVAQLEKHKEGGKDDCTNAKYLLDHADY